MTSDEENLRTRLGKIFEDIVVVIASTLILAFLTYILPIWTGLAAELAIVVALFVALIFLVISWGVIFKPHKSIQTPSGGGITTTKPKGVSNEILSNLGVVDALSGLKESGYEPLECVKKTRKSLFFMGIMGSKWVSEAHVRSDLEQLLKKVETSGGSVRFLLLNPKSASFTLMKDLRNGALSEEPLSHFRTLAAKFPSLQVRIYDELPCFRMVIIDDKTLVLSHYVLDKKSYLDSGFGWGIPQIIINADTKWSIFIAFERYYRSHWDQAVDLT